MATRSAKLFGILFAVTAVFLWLGLFYGSSSLAFREFWDDAGTVHPILKLRMIRVIAAFTVGAALAMSGTAFQAVLRNPLAEPFILGVSGGAAVGAALAFILGLAKLSIYAVPGMALGGALSALALVLLLAFRHSGGANDKLLLSGVIVGTMSSSILSCLISFSQMEELCSLSWWLLGDLQTADLSLLWPTVLLTVAGAAVLYWNGFRANAVAMGDAQAWNAGINPRRTAVLLIVVASLLAASTVALAGIIGFVGLLIPHLLRRIAGADNRKLFLLSFLGGGAFLLGCDLLSRIIYPNRELPIGVITSLLGGPLFLWMLNRKPGGGE